MRFPTDPTGERRRTILLAAIASFVPLVGLAPELWWVVNGIAGSTMIALTLTTAIHDPLDPGTLLVDAMPEAPPSDATIAACVRLLAELDTDTTVLERRLHELDAAQRKLEAVRAHNAQAGGTAAELAPLTHALDGVQAEIDELCSHCRQLHSTLLAQTLWTERPSLSRTTVTLGRAAAELELRSL